MLKNYLKAGFGGASSQLIHLIGIPVISRLYSPDVYATWAIIIATSSIFGSIACFRYELAVVIPKSETKASYIFWLCILSSFGVGIFAILLMSTNLFLSSNPESYVNNFVTLKVLISTLIISMGVTYALQYWNVRQRAFMLNSLGLIALSFVTLSTQILYAITIEASFDGLVLGSLVGQLSIILLYLLGLFYIKSPELIKFNYNDFVKIAKEHHRFLIYSTPYTLFGVLRARGVVLILEMFLYKRFVGLFAFAYRIMNFPVSLVSGAIRPVLFKESAQKGVESIEQRVNQLLILLSFCGIPFVVGYFYYAEEIFLVLFGEKWAGSGEIGKFIILPAFTFVMCNWMDRIMDVLKQQRLTLILEVTFASTSIFSLWIGFVLSQNLYVALGMQCAILVLYNICYLTFVYKIAGYQQRFLGKLFIANVFFAILIIFCIESIIK